MKKILHFSMFIIALQNIFGQLNDEFNTTTLDPSWNLHQSQFFKTPVPLENGSMTMEVTCSDDTCAWFHEDSAGFIYKTLSGDFDVSTAVFTKSRRNPANDITNDTQLAGLMVRDPGSTSGSDSYVFNVAGMRFDVPSVETKTTINGRTTRINPYTDNMTGTAAELRIVREGSLFSMYSRAIGATSWIFRTSYTRTDIPSTVQVGLIAYVFGSFPVDLQARFDYIRFNGGSTTPPSPVTVAAPSSLRTTTISSDQINLSWADNSNNETGFEIERSANGSTYTRVGSVAANVTTFPNSGLSDATRYFYRVRAINSTTTSNYSNTIEATTNSIPLPPPAPGNNSGSIFEDVARTGTIPVTLHPEQPNQGQPTLVAFGVPFPRSTVFNVNQIKVTDAQGNEIPSNVTETLGWHSLSNDSSVGGIRSALIYIERTFTNTNPVNIQVVYGEGHSQELGPQGSVRNTWTNINDANDEYSSSVTLTGPRVYATLSPDWMDKCVVRTRFNPVGNVSQEYQWHSSAMVETGRRAVNEVGSGIDVNVASAWLYDRAGVIWNLYLKTGELKWLKASHKASQFYADRIDSNGSFTLKRGDFKYSYGGSMLIDIMFTGDVGLKDKIEDVAAFGARENHELTSRKSFWTERHFSYWVLSSLSAFEATGNTSYLTQTNQRVAHAFTIAKNPINGYTAEGGLIHPLGIHEGTGSSAPIISPWMSALLSDAIWRYYLHSEDDQALEFLVGLGENVANHGIYQSGGSFFPYYLVSGQVPASDRNGSPYREDFPQEHAVDVSGLLARAFWAQKKLGANSSSVNFSTSINNLIATARPVEASPSVRPARKYSWKYGSTSDFDWLMTNEPDASTPPPTPVTVAAPSSLVATAVSSRQIDLSWIDNSNNEDSFIVERSTNGINYAEIASVAGNTTSYTDENLNPDTTYFYRIQAEGSGVVSEYSNAVEARTETEIVVIAAPSGLSASNITETSVVLGWADNANNETGFDIERSTNGSTFTRVGSVTANASAFTNTGLTRATQYFYRVRAIGASTVSGYSNSINITTATGSTPDPVPTPGDNDGSIYENLPSTGEVLITLHPGSTVTAGSAQLVSFGVPFPRSLVNNTSQIIVTDASDEELPSDIKETLRWHSLSDDSNVGGVRSALVHVNVTFPSVSPITIKVKYGQNRSLELGAQGDVKDSWVTVRDTEDEYMDNTSDSNYVELKEPPVYATLPSSWMNTCVIRTKFVPSNQVSADYQWYDDAMLNFGASSINDVADTVLEEHKVNPLQRSIWLYDRAGAFWNLYFRTGELRWLKSAHKASQFYSKFLDDRGRFTLGNPSWLDDLKYSFGGSMLIDIMMTGDTALTDKIIDVAEFAARDNYELREGYGFFTERHFTYWLLAPLSAFEATGNPTYKDQANQRAAHAFFRAKNPVNGYQAEGGMIHPMGPHEGLNRPAEGAPDERGYFEPIISPWMSALLSDAIWRYYLQSEDDNALEFLAGLGENVARHCIYEVTAVHPNIDRNKQAYYLWSGQTDARFTTHFSFNKPWTDDEHTPDVAGLLARAFWAQKKLGLDSSEVTSQIASLFETAKYTIAKSTRTTPTLPRYRVTPPRRFGWQFGTTSDLEWLMTNIPGQTANPPVPDTEAPSIPQNLVSTGQSETTVALSWTASSDNVGVTRYFIYRDGGSTPIARVTGTTYTDTGLTASTTYSYTVRAIDASGNESDSSNAVSITTDDDIVTTDTEAPTQPTDLVASNITSSGVTLSWTASTDNVGVTGYIVHRYGGDSESIDFPVSGPSFSDTGLTPGTEYGYAVRAVDASGNESAHTILLVTTTDIVSSDPIFGTFNPGITGIVEVSPAPGSTNVPVTSKVIVRIPAGVYSDEFTSGKTFRLYKEGKSDPIFEYISSHPHPMTGQSELVFDTPVLDPDTNYYVLADYSWVRFNAAPWRAYAIGDGAWTFRTAAEALDTEAPSIPQDVVSTGQSETTIDLNWEASTDNVEVTGYHIYRDGGNTPIATVTETTYVDSDLTVGTAYSYTVSAVDETGNESAQSSALSITTTDTVSSDPIFGTFNPSINGIVEVSPAPGSTNVPVTTKMIVRIPAPVYSDPYVNEEGIRLYKEGESTPVFQYVFSHPEPMAGQSELVFDIPTLEPNTNYYVLANFTWVRFNAAPWRAYAIEEGAWRFSTGASVDALTVNEEAAGKIYMHSNPVKQTMALNIPITKENGAFFNEISIYDLNGRKLKTFQVKDYKATKHLFDVGELNLGMYFVKVRYKDFDKVIMFCKE